jgi:hypothetical protein
LKKKPVLQAVRREIEEGTFTYAFYKIEDKGLAKPKPYPIRNGN